MCLLCFAYLGSSTTDFAVSVVAVITVNVCVSSDVCGVLPLCSKGAAGCSWLSEGNKWAAQLPEGLGWRWQLGY